MDDVGGPHCRICWGSGLEKVRKNDVERTDIENFAQ